MSIRNLKNSVYLPFFDVDEGWFCAEKKCQLYFSIKISPRDVEQHFRTYNFHSKLLLKIDT